MDQGKFQQKQSLKIQASSFVVTGEKRFRISLQIPCFSGALSFCKSLLAFETSCECIFLK